MIAWVVVAFAMASEVGVSVSGLDQAAFIR